MGDANETWRPVAAFDNYQVSDRGRVRRTKSLRQVTCRVGRRREWYVDLYRNRRPTRIPVARLVAAAFKIDLPVDGNWDVQFANANPRDCRLQNLVVVSHATEPPLLNGEPPDEGVRL